MSMTIERAKSELMQIYGALSPDKQRAIDTLLHTINVREYDKDHIWYKGKQYISLNRFLQVKEPCEDAISRDELLKAIDTWDKFGVDDTNSLFRLDNLSLPHYVPYIHYDDVVKCIKGMPSVNPQEPKTGHWIDDEFGSKCSCCGIHTHLDKFDRPMKFKHCSMCGARMESEVRNESID